MTPQPVSADTSLTPPHVMTRQRQHTPIEMTPHLLTPLSTKTAADTHPSLTPNNADTTGSQGSGTSSRVCQQTPREVWTVGQRAPMHAHCTHRLQTCRSRRGLLTPTQGGVSD